MKDQNKKNVPSVNDKGFDSLFRQIYEVVLPNFSGTRIMMLPVIIGDPKSLPEFVKNYRETFEQICNAAQKHNGEVGYLTVDEKTVEVGKTHRRSGAHVDGIYQGGSGGWGGGSTGGSWGGHGNGMLTVSNPAGCRAWLQWFDGWPGFEGEADHLMNQAKDECATLFKPNMLYWVDGLCVHESVKFDKPVQRQFVRLSLPSDGPWFEGYTVNPLGVMPTGKILPPRKFMAA
jgi:hypothetical protein